MAANHEKHGLLLAAAILLLLLFLLAKLRRRRKKYGGVPLNPPPGPWQLPVIGSMHHLVGALPHRAMRDLALRHGPLMLLRMGELPVVVASSAAAARDVLKTHDAAFATRPRTNTIATLDGDGLGFALAPYGDHWRRVRKLCVTELLGAPRVRSFQGTREAEAAALVASVAAAAASGDVVNVSSLVSTYVVDAAVRVIVGDRIAGRDAFLACLEEGLRLSSGFSLADLFPSSRLARALSRRSRQVEAAAQEMSRVMDGVIEEKRARKAAGNGMGREEEQDILDVLLDGGGTAPLDIGTIRAVVRDLFGAGSESSASTLQWAMAELMRRPAALRRAQAEVRGALAGQSRVREEALQELPYLRLVIKETLRLHATVPLMLPRESREATRVLGYDVPQGTMVLVNAWAIGRDAATFGADAEEFRPERFEEGTAAALDFRGTDFELLPFGAGRRMCPGITFGLAVMELALASLLFHFDWELPGGTVELDMAETFGVTAKMKNDLWLHAAVVVPPL
ncbi:desmethyl-deoxy-podophyllotoxin synthase-like [Aegilops tauschii subsp. strangulata]|nr:desmethyl-deoxy-podophyllotoxin synthase-like [Triticum aestivum]XP_045087548.1 desmethyl-deoxy-podophyllotoxin synthase-like [Aegilops tauschii subsp. strangulata]